MTTKSQKPDVREKPTAAQQPSRGKPGLAAHKEALERLEDLLGSTMSDDSKVLIRQFARTVRNRMRPWQRVVYEEHAPTEPKPSN